ncbi:MAG: RluA family pseudouridine synthase [bacterium]|nr:RluA family pseudouridine synthase [bacterium]
MKRVLNCIVPDEFDGQRLDTLLRSRYKMSGSLIKDLKRAEDGLLVNGSRARTVDLLHNGDSVTLTLHEYASENIPPVKLSFKTVYEDEDLLIVSKPAGMPTHTSQGNFLNTLSNAVMYHFMENGEEHVFRAVNRLDKDTSGLMCIAKNKYVHARLCADFHSKAVKRSYLAIVCGVIRGEGTIDLPIARENDSVIKRVVRSDGARSITHYKGLDVFSGYSLVELELETGRTHQIRVHMAHIGAPLLGDWLYGSEDKGLFSRQALHSYRIKLTHPVTGAVLEFEEPLPYDMMNFFYKFSKSPCILC